MSTRRKQTWRCVSAISRKLPRTTIGHRSVFRESIPIFDSSRERQRWSARKLSYSVSLNTISAGAMKAHEYLCKCFESIENYMKLLYSYCTVQYNAPASALR